MIERLFGFAQRVEQLPPKRNKHYTRNFTRELNPHNLKNTLSSVADIIYRETGSNPFVSNVNIKQDIDYRAGLVGYFWVSFSYAYSDSQLTTPWDVAQSGAITFLLCAKLLKLHRDVSLIVAKKVYTNVAIKELYTFIWSGTTELTWVVDNWVDRNFLHIGACLECKYPCQTTFCEKCKIIKNG